MFLGGTHFGVVFEGTQRTTILLFFFGGGGGGGGGGVSYFEKSRRDRKIHPNSRSAGLQLTAWRIGSKEGEMSQHRGPLEVVCFIGRLFGK